MPAPSSKVDICNLALDWLGQNADIANIDDPQNDDEIIFSRHYDSVRQGLLRAYAFSFSQKEVQLAPVPFPNGRQITEDYLSRFKLPDDCLRLLRCGGAFFRPRDYILEQNYLLIAAKWTTPGFNRISIRYVFDQTDVKTFDPLFIKFLALELACELSYKYQRSRDDVDRIMAVRDDARQKVVGTSGQESKPKRIDISREIQARWVNTELIHSPSGLFWFDMP